MTLGIPWMSGFCGSNSTFDRKFKVALASDSPGPPMRLAVLCLAALLAIVAPARADEEQVTLASSTVESYLISHAALEGLATRLATKFGDRTETEGDDPVHSLPAYQDIPEARVETAEILTRFGFIDLADHRRVENSVLLAYQYLDPATRPPEVATEKARAVAEVEQDVALSPDQKKAALDQIETQYNELATYVPIPGNIETVRPFADRIAAIGEGN